MLLNTCYNHESTKEDAAGGRNPNFGWHIDIGESGPDAVDEFLVAAFDSVCRVESRPIGIDGILPGGDETFRAPSVECSVHLRADRVPPYASLQVLS
jgi:hypothetical protein